MVQKLNPFDTFLIFELLHLKFYFLFQLLCQMLFLLHLDIGQEKPKYGARDERVSTLRRRAAAPLRRYSN